MNKFILTLFAMSFIVSCSKLTSTTSNGFGPRDFPITMGSQSSVDVVIAMDKLWKEGDFDGMREHISDSARFVWEDGRVHSREEFINSLKSLTVTDFNIRLSLFEEQLIIKKIKKNLFILVIVFLTNQS